MAVFRCSEYGMPFSPHAVMADKYIRNMRVVVVLFRKYPDKVLHLFKENRIVIIRLQITVHFVMLRACVENPAGGSRFHPVLGSRNAKRYLSALVDPPLGRRIKYFPDEIVLFRLNKSPGETEEHRVHSGEITDGVGRSQLGSIILIQVGIEIRYPSHPGIDERLSVVDRFRVMNRCSTRISYPGEHRLNRCSCGASFRAHPP